MGCDRVCRTGQRANDAHTHMRFEMNESNDKEKDKKREMVQIKDRR